jgi:hypothetical protein
MFAVYLKFRIWLLGFSLVVLGLATVIQGVQGQYLQSALFGTLALLLVGLDFWLWRPSARPRHASLLDALRLHDGMLQLGMLDVRQADIVRIETGFIDQQRAFLLLHCYDQTPQRLYFPTAELAEVRQWLSAHLDSRLLAEADFHLL